MQIKQLNKSTYAGRKFTARYFTDGYYDIRQTESGFNIAYTPFEKTLEKSLDYEFFEEWLEDPVAFGAFDGENLLGFVEGSVEEWNGEVIRRAHGSPRDADLQRKSDCVL